MDRRKFLKQFGASAVAAIPGAALARELSEMNQSTTVAGALAAPKTLDHPVKPKLLIAHRGASAYAAENTLEAYRLAIAQGADLVEQDLQITKDGILVCLHDGYLETTTNAAEVFPDRFTEVEEKGKKVKRWLIYTFTLAEVKQLATRSRTGEPAHPATTIPTWQEAIDDIRGKAGLCPETKSPEEFTKRGFNMNQLVADVLKHNGLLTAKAGSDTPVLMQSFSREGLTSLKKYGVDHPMLWLTSSRTPITPALVAQAKDIGASSIGPHKSQVNKGVVDLTHKAGLKMIPYTYDYKTFDKAYNDVAHEMSHHLYSFGIDGLFTNNPDMFPRAPLNKPRTGSGDK